MRIFVILLAIVPSISYAKCMQWGRSLNGGYLVCMMDDLVNHNPIIPIESPCLSAGGCGGVVITNSSPKCDDGWTMVHDGNNYMCARELRKPQ